MGAVVVADGARSTRIRPPFGPALAVTLGVATLAAPTLAIVAGLQVDYPAFFAFPAIILLFAPAWAAMARAGVDRGAHALGLFLAVAWLSLPVLVLSYAAVRIGLPLADAQLFGWDRALGLDATWAIRMAGKSGAAAGLLDLAYLSFTPQILLIGPLLALYGDARRGESFVIGFALVSIASIVVSIGFPAVGTGGFLQLDATTTGAIDVHFSRYHLPSLLGAHGDPGFVLSPGVAAGIVTFPSIHAAVAVVAGWATWTVRGWRWPSVALNAAMFASAVTHGGHYSVDLLAGGAIAVATILLLSRRGGRAGGGGARSA